MEGEWKSAAVRRVQSSAPLGYSIATDSGTDFFMQIKNKKKMHTTLSDLLKKGLDINVF